MDRGSPGRDNSPRHGQPRVVDEKFYSSLGVNERTAARDQSLLFIDDVRPGPSSGICSESLCRRDRGREGVIEGSWGDWVRIGICH